MKQREDSKQTLIDWPNPTAAATSPASSIPDPIKLVAQASPPLVECLPWDFATTFPPPTDEAIDTGIVHETDVLPENLKALHENFIEQLLSNRRQLDKVLDARRRSVDPATDKPPTTHAGPERSPGRSPESLNREFDTLLLTYEKSFGPQAAHAFNRFIIARHAGIPVELQEQPNAVGDAAPVPPATKSRRHPGSSALPVPRPLPGAVRAGHFGFQDDKPINPTSDEVRAITEQHAEQILALLDGQRQMERSYTAPQCSDRARAVAEADRLKKLVRSQLEKYAMSFGLAAAEQLKRYISRKTRER